MEQVYDKLPSGTLDEFDEFRNKTYNYTYLCRDCTRSFDSKTELKTCKFCDGTIVLLRRVDRVKKGVLNKPNPRYHYVCSTCDAEFDSDDPINNCHYCKTKWLHVYRWEDLGKSDKFTIKFMGAIKNFVNKKEGHRTRIHSALAEENKELIKTGVPKPTSDSRPNENESRQNEKKLMRKRYFSISDRFNFKRASKEEMPTY